MKTKIISVFFVTAAICLMSCTKVDENSPVNSSNELGNAKSSSKIQLSAIGDSSSVIIDWDGASNAGVLTLNRKKSHVTNFTYHPGNADQNLTISQIGLNQYQINVIGTSSSYTLDVVKNTSNEVLATLRDDISLEDATLSFVSVPYDMRLLVGPWKDGFVEDDTPGGWGWVAGLIISIGVGVVLEHCGDIVEDGINGCVEAGGLPQTGFCSVGCT